MDFNNSYKDVTESVVNKVLNEVDFNIDKDTQMKQFAKNGNLQLFAKAINKAYYINISNDSNLLKQHVLSLLNKMNTSYQENHDVSSSFNKFLNFHIYKINANIINELNNKVIQKFGMSLNNEIIVNDDGIDDDRETNYYLVSNEIINNENVKQFYNAKILQGMSSTTNVIDKLFN